MKVAKFGGSSVANASQIKKVVDIVLADKDRRIVVVSAPGKRLKEDTKVTDLLITLAETIISGKDGKLELKIIIERFKNIVDELSLSNELLEEIQNETKTTILYEAPHKLETTLKDLKEIICDRKIVLAREITKIHEEYLRENIDELIEKAKDIKGEIVLILEGAKKNEEELWTKVSIEEHYKYYEEKGLNKKEIIKQIAKDRNVNKNEIYQKFLER